MGPLSDLQTVYSVCMEILAIIFLLSFARRVVGSKNVL